MMTYVFVYGNLLTRQKPYTASLRGEMRLRVKGDPGARFGSQYQSRVFGQINAYTPSELFRLAEYEAPQYAMRQVSTWQGEPLYAFEDVQPNFTDDQLISTGRWLDIPMSRRPMLVQKARKGKGQGIGMKGADSVQRLMENAVKIDLTKGIQTFKRKVTAEDIEKAVRSGGYGAVVRTLRKSDFAGTMRDYVTRGISETLANTAEKSINVLPAPTQKNLRYDTANPRMNSYIDTRVGELITTSEKGMLTTVRDAVRSSFDRGLDAPAVAQRIRQSIGLNVPQARALLNYRSSLINAKEPLSPAAINRQVLEYNDRLLDQRSLMIARTEVRNAISQGETDVWKEGIDQGLLPADAQRVWVVDAEPCPEWCEDMEDVPTGISEPWRVVNTESGEVKLVDVPSQVHPNCMCFQDMRF